MTAGASDAPSPSHRSPLAALLTLAAPPHTAARLDTRLRVAASPVRPACQFKFARRTARVRAPAPWQPGCHGARCTASSIPVRSAHAGRSVRAEGGGGWGSHGLMEPAEGVAIGMGVSE
jgi:hypothetical protein